MKRTIFLLALLLVAVFGFTGCARTPDEGNDSDFVPPSNDTVTQNTPAPPQNDINPANPSNPSQSAEDVTSEPYEAPEMPTIGDIITFGAFNWRVLDVQDDRALIISDTVMMTMPYHDDVQYPNLTWANSDIRGFLNDNLLESFHESLRARIIRTTNQNLDNQWFGTEGGEDTEDYIFLLSLEEVVRYFGDSGELANGNSDMWLFADRYSDNRIVPDADDIASWWLRSPGADSLNNVSGNTAASVLTNGSVNVRGGWVNGSAGVRPAMWISME